ncbi:hypothetical protein AB0F90_27390, partial [Micromonospora chalcea]
PDRDGFPVPTRHQVGAAQTFDGGEGCWYADDTPDRAARTAIGRNVLDPARRAASARAGFAQADTVAAEVAGVWR